MYRLWTLEARIQRGGDPPALRAGYNWDHTASRVRAVGFCRQPFFANRKPAVWRAFYLNTRFYRTGLCPVWSKRGASDVATSSISHASPRAGKHAHSIAAPSQIQSTCFDLERKNGGADTEPPRLSAAAAWSKPVLTMPEGVFPPHMSPEKRLILFVLCTNSARLEGSCRCLYFLCCFSVKNDVF